METQKIVNLLSCSNNAMQIQNLQQKNVMLLTVNQKVFIHTKMKSKF